MIETKLNDTFQKSKKKHSVHPFRRRIEVGSENPKTQFQSDYFIFSPIEVDSM
ncbi:hypothetical protein LEP1GSC161_1136 [Leptospira santarosai str. CBC1416]|nr:hypothetical protein LEP1GSC179_2929 [Leptospira santarosai str. MOR084]EKO77078.1 hypothetical protein LEP1GSC068_3340 [Leptospira sp. Fiocruz LV3954]EKR91646.1 hypothetical protein LEP1GSC163_3044 [Leptospira santarosai str. CBC379]EKS10415.1 hypothetical protein LEP1GSC071_2697 [Leptospira santarosai str. JET]EMF88913.1 hypothetical protein LEP1GSC005_1532 [Leptospira santarosai str. ST188]EMI62221.1 hypothetical protein LEP1GSC076_3408 [Leptospira sp. Fiocruz LV4135]EMJ47738.1 hypothet